MQGAGAPRGCPPQKAARLNSHVEPAGEKGISVNNRKGKSYAIRSIATKTVLFSSPAAGTRTAKMIDAVGLR